jgi:GAF domain-containing protein/CheY-like chemotaxis protein
VKKNSNPEIPHDEQADKALLRRLSELTVLHSIATACVECTNEDELIERATQAIGEKLYPDSFGILLLDEAARDLHFHRSYRGLPDKYKGISIPLGEGITGQVAATGAARRANDVTQAPGYLHLYFQARAELCVPIKIGERVIGVINAESLLPDIYSEDDERLLTTLAGQLATTIERLRVEAAERQRMQELLAVTRVSREITSKLDPQQVLDSIVRHAVELSNSDASGVFIYRPDGRFYLAATCGTSDEFIKATNMSGVPSEGSAIGRAVLERRPVQITDVVEDPVYQVGYLAKIENIRAILALPMLRGEEIVGGIVLWHRQPRRFTNEEVLFLQALSQQSVNAIENARLFEETHRRASLLEALNAVIGAAAAAKDLNTLLETSLDHTLQALNLEIGGIRVGNHSIARQTSPEVIPLFVKAALDAGPSFPNPMIIEDWFAKAEEEPFQATAKIAIKHGLRASLVVSISAGGQRIGALSVSSLTPRSWAHEEIALTEAIGKQLGAAVERLRLLEETQRRLNEATLLGKVITLTTSAGDLSSALSQVCSEVALFFQAPQAAFALLNRDGTAAEIIAEYRLAGRSSALGLQIPVAGNPSMAFILENKLPLAVTDAQNDPVLAPVHEIMRQREVASILLVPILMRGKVTGTLGIDNLQRHEFSQTDIALMQNVASQVGQALERVQLFEAMREHALQMTKLARLSGDLNRANTLEGVFKGIGQGVMELGQVDQAAIFVRTAEAAISCPWHQGLSQAYLDQATFQFQEVPGKQYLQSTAPLLISDGDGLQPGSPLLQDPSAQERYFAIGFWPLVYEGQTIATVGCYYNAPLSWLEDRREVMMAFTRQAAVALQNARLFDEIRHRAAQQEAINAIIAAAVTAPDLPNLLKVVLKLTLKALVLKKGAIWVPGQSVLFGVPSQFNRDKQRFASMRGMEIPGPVVISDWKQVHKDHPLAPLRGFMSENNFVATLTVPVIAETVRIGGISLASSEPKTWSAEEIALVETIGRQVGGTVERLNLFAKTQEQARQVQQIMDTVPDGVLLLNADRRVALANPAARLYLSTLVGDFETGEPLTHLAGYALDDLLNENPEMPWREFALADAPHRIFEIAARSLEGKGQNEGWVLVLRDVSRERETQARMQVQDRLATVGQLAAGIAHDFNNIMAAIVVYAELLALEPNLSQPSQDRLVIIQQQIQRATSLIRQILDFSRRSVMEQSSLDLLSYIKELDKLLGRVLPENIRLELSYQPGSYLVNADPTRLQQVFMNLALNARDAMPSGGVLHFELMRFKLKAGNLPPVPDLTEGEWIRIEVRDTGLGIQPEVMPHIFDPFFSTKPVGEGTGLGLAQVYGIIKQHGGSIDVQSQIDDGTSFYIYLPALPVPEEEMPSQALFPELKGAGETVLVVEDDWVARDALQALLEAYDYRTMVASNGIEALQIYSRKGEGIAAVVSDVVMPEMGGVALYHALRAKKPEIKMLLITGHPLDPEDQTLLEEGQVHWMQKPFNVTDFIHHLRDLLKEPA